MEGTRLVVLASGAGTLLHALAECHLGNSIVAVGSDQPEAPVVARARELGFETFVVPMSEDRNAWNDQLVTELERFSPDWIICAGFMRILSTTVLDRFPQRFINAHPSLLPGFPGAHAVRDALAYGAKVTGCTVHIVDSGVDTGPIIAQQPVTVENGDDESSLHERIKQVERVLLVDVVEKIIERGLVVNGRSVAFG